MNYKKYLDIFSDCHLVPICLSGSMANKKELLILGATVASATVGMYFYTENTNRDDQPIQELLSSVETAQSVVESGMKLQNVSSAMDITEDSSDGGLKKDVIVKKEDAIDKEDIPTEAEDEVSAKKGSSPGFQQGGDEFSVGVDERRKNTSPGQDLRKDPPDPGTPAFRSLKKVYKEGYN